MRKYKHIILVLIVGILTTAFQCSSTEITSAKLYISQKNYDKALEALEREVAKNPQSDEGWYLLGSVYAEKENYSEMIKAYNKSLSISDKFKANIEDQKKYHWANLFNKGVTQFQRGVNSQNPDSTKLYFERSINAFEYAVALQPDSADTYKNLAFVYMNNQKYDEAIPHLEKLIELDQELDGYRFLGEILYNRGIIAKEKYQAGGTVEDSIKAMELLQEAIVVLEEGRKNHPNDSEILITLSNAYIAADKIDVAIDAFKAGVEQDPENKYYRYNYGVLLLNSENYPGAEEQFLEAIDSDPEYQNALYNLAVTYVRWGSKINKESELTNGDNSEYKKKFEQALEYLERYVELNNTDPAVWELLGTVYSVLNMQDDATSAFQRADELR
jgi:tetratricopeptide (TPR) repeat protein